MKNRTVIGIVCIILSVALVFVVSPMVNKASDKKTSVVRFVKDVSHGAEIKDTDIELVNISNTALPEKVILDKALVVGKFATADLFKGDLATESKVTDNANSAKDVLASLTGDKLAMSITINSFAGGLSAKLQNGDVVSIYVTDKDNVTTNPPELRYVKVITTTTATGIDENEVIANEDGSFTLPTTITVLVTVEQARILANYEESASMHVALVYRGDDANAEKFLKAQDEFLNKPKVNAGDNNG